MNYNTLMEVTMKEDFSIRLQKAMNIRNIKATELSEKAHIPKSAISQYLSGLYEAKQKSIFKLANALNVSEGWLMGLDVPMEKETTNNDFRYANNNGINTEGLDENDIEEINRFVEFIKNKKKNEKK